VVAESRGTNGSSSAERSGVSPAFTRDTQRGSSFSESLSSRGPRLRNCHRQLTDTAEHGRGVAKLRETLNVSTWNVRTMRTDGRQEILEGKMKRSNIGCLGISDTCWWGVGHIFLDSGSTVINSGGDEHIHGVVEILNKSLSRALMGYNPLNERLLTARIISIPWNLTFIHAYAPTNQATDQDKSAFYERLEQVYLQVPWQDTVIIGGDMNAKIGEGCPIGRHAFGTMNDNGARLVNFARANAFVAANCLMRRHPRRLYTWKSFDLTCSNQIDYFLVQERWNSSICKCKAIQGAECDSDSTPDEIQVEAAPATKSKGFYTI